MKKILSTWNLNEHPYIYIVIIWTFEQRLYNLIGDSSLTKFSIISSARCFVRLRVDSHLTRSISHKLLIWNKKKKYILLWYSPSYPYYIFTDAGKTWVNDRELSKYCLSTEMKISRTEIRLESKLWNDIPCIGCGPTHEINNQSRHWRIKRLAQC